MGNKLKVVELFAGYGSQDLALTGIGIEHETVAVCEIDIDASISYAAIRHDLDIVVQGVLPSQIIKLLKDRNIGYNFKTKENDIMRLRPDKLKLLYNAVLKSNNLGDISRVNGEDLPDHDLLTYSFPCTDISSAGKQKGFSKGSKTRSSLLWECEKVISAKKPKYLLLENVGDLVGTKYIKDFEEWLRILEGYGYSNYWKIVNSLDHGIPQSRNRVFVVSILDKEEYFLFPGPRFKTLNLEDIIDKTGSSDRYKLMPSEANALDEQAYDLMGDYGLAYSPTSREYRGFKPYSPTLCARDFCGPKIWAIRNKEGKFDYRRSSPIEYWRLMGVPDWAYNRVKAIGISDNSMYKMAGNSIAVPVLEDIFYTLFKDKGYNFDKEVEKKYIDRAI